MLACRHVVKQETPEILLITFVIKTAQNIEGIVWEETLVVEGVWKQLSHCRAAHLFVMLMLITLMKYNKVNANEQLRSS